MTDFNTTCKVEGCERESIDSIGYCKKHKPSAAAERGDWTVTWIANRFNVPLPVARGIADAHNAKMAQHLDAAEQEILLLQQQLAEARESSNEHELHECPSKGICAQCRLRRQLAEANERLANTYADLNYVKQQLAEKGEAIENLHKILGKKRVEIQELKQMSGFSEPDLQSCGSIERIEQARDAAQEVRKENNEST